MHQFDICISYNTSVIHVLRQPQKLTGIPNLISLVCENGCLINDTVFISMIDSKFTVRTAKTIAICIIGMLAEQVNISCGKNSTSENSFSRRKIDVLPGIRDTGIIARRIIRTVVSSISILCSAAINAPPTVAIIRQRKTEDVSRTIMHLNIWHIGKHGVIFTGNWRLIGAVAINCCMVIAADHNICSAGKSELRHRIFTSVLNDVGDLHKGIFLLILRNFSFGITKRENRCHINLITNTILCILRIKSGNVASDICRNFVDLILIVQVIASISVCCSERSAISPQIKKIAIPIQQQICQIRNVVGFAGRAIFPICIISHILLKLGYDLSSSIGPAGKYEVRVYRRFRIGNAGRFGIVRQTAYAIADHK